MGLPSRRDGCDAGTVSHAVGQYRARAALSKARKPKRGPGKMQLVWSSKEGVSRLAVTLCLRPDVIRKRRRPSSDPQVARHAPAAWPGTVKRYRTTCV